MSEPTRVLFVGSELNPMSISVLEALALAPDLEVTVLASQPHRRGFVATFQRTWREYGPGTIVRGGLRLVQARGRSALRSLGLRLRGYGSLSELAQATGVRVLPADHINAKATVALVRESAPDLILVSAFDQILKPTILSVPRLGCVNVHPSLLPCHRGANPFYWVIQRGDARTGITIHLIDEGIDTGDVLAQEEIEIEPGETEGSLQRRSAELAARMAPTVARGLRDGTLTPRPQPKEGATYDPKPPRGASSL